MTVLITVNLKIYVVILNNVIRKVILSKVFLSIVIVSRNHSRNLLMGLINKLG